MSIHEYPRKHNSENCELNRTRNTSRASTLDVNDANKVSMESVKNYAEVVHPIYILTNQLVWVLTHIYMFSLWLLVYKYM